MRSLGQGCLSSVPWGVQRAYAEGTANGNEGKKRCHPEFTRWAVEAFPSPRPEVAVALCGFRWSEGGVPGSHLTHCTMRNFLHYFPSPRSGARPPSHRPTGSVSAPGTPSRASGCAVASRPLTEPPPALKRCLYRSVGWLCLPATQPVECRIRVLPAAPLSVRGLR